MRFGRAISKKIRSGRRSEIQRKSGKTPVGYLRPGVRCSTVKYNSKIRLGRGFTADELSSAGINKKVALSMGISIDKRRRNRSQESLDMNIQRLKNYLELYTEGSAAMRCSIEEVSVGKMNNLFPVTNDIVYEAPRPVTEEERSFNAVSTLKAVRQWDKAAGHRRKERLEKAAA